MLDINPQVIPQIPDLFVQLAATLILFLVMRHFLFKPVKKLLDDRKNFIEEGVKTAEEAKLAIERSQEEYDKRILEAKKESSEIISQARVYGEDLKNKAVQESKALAQAEYDKSIKAIESEREKTMKSMNDEIVDIAISAAEKVLREKVGKDTDKKMVKSLIKDLEDSYE
ncbi:F0F1 ATP synthase subunit B [Helcococcus kunzii]|uniref:F0F1 ATP synthase subunit B n=1 Tax=Helcococcus kunzii TaxID=40091 RepID=UPI0024AD6ED1|nr:F0F1 ATP synthase subunit B [Helcococcus kunzii]